MKHIKDAVGLFIKDMGLGQRREENIVFEEWKEIAGDETAAMAEPFKLEGGRLYLQVENSVTMSEVTYRKAKIKASVNRRLKNEKIREIIVRIKQD